ncbi:MAG: electron transport complex subunit E [Spirochaetaceae bacterium]|nr:electron transport complex subunit E [Spirochaetaceae bacterium]
MKNLFKIFTNGLMKENPLLVLMIGLCSSLAVTTSVSNGMGMGLAMTFVLVMSEIIISLFRKLIPDSIRIPVFIIVIATFVTIVDLLMQAYLPDLAKSLGVFIPLIVVNCIIMGRVESFASKNGVLSSMFDALGMGLGYFWVLTGISLVRELLGAGTFFGMTVIPEAYTIKFFSGAPGGFFVFGLFIAANTAINAVMQKKAKKSSEGDA